ncbi:MAG TPA: hypothetical protein VLF40_02835 [Candidatus Saccharimonadales bacterium]|nr:hypothetical protein [Candidatus Saccharimonadales bacterium]
MEQHPPTPEFQEEPPIPDLEAIYADRIGNMMGMVAPYRDLAKLCPIDKSDPRWTRAAVNRMIIITENEAGNAVAPEHADYFRGVLEEAGEVVKIRVEAPEPVERSEPEAPSRVAREEPKQQRAPHAQEKLARSVERAETMSRREVAKAAEIQVGKVAATEAPVAARPTPVPAMTPRANAMPTERFRRQIEESSTRVLEVARKMVVEAFEPLSEPVLVRGEVPDSTPREAVSVGPSSEVVSPLNEAVGTVVPEVEEPAVLSDFAVSVELEPIVDVEATTEMTPAVELEVWATEIRKDPSELLADFTAALHEFSKPEIIETAAVPEEIAPVVTELAVRLETLDEDAQEQSMQLVQTIVGAVHGLKVLQLREGGVPVGALEATEAELIVACEELFALAHMELTEEEVHQFVQFLMSSNFAEAFARAAGMPIDYDPLNEHFFGPLAASDYQSPSLSLLRLARVALWQPVTA